MPTLADEVARLLCAHGVERLYGIPGGGSSLDLIDAGARSGLPFVLARTEAAATIMAAVTGELTGAPGAALVGVGPGASSAVNGVAYADIERAPMVLFMDGPASSRHQHFEQLAIYAPLARGTARLRPETGPGDLDDLLSLAVRAPEGPVAVEMTAADAARDVDILQTPAAPPPAAPEPARLDAARAMLGAARKPLFLVGLESRGHADAVRALVDTTGAPAMTTYKASGVIDAASPTFIGPVTGAAGEMAVLEDADLIVGVGLDPVEFIPGTWPDAVAPVLQVTEGARENPRLPVACRVEAPLGPVLNTLSHDARASDWRDNDIADLRNCIGDIYAPKDGKSFSNAALVRTMAAVLDPATRLCVDAGAHMFAVFGLWPAARPFGILKSNGLSTMGYALPAAVASRLCDPDTPVVAITGDGGLAMCLGELATAAENDIDLTVVVVNDAALSLIDIKQQRQQRPSLGVRYPIVDFAAVARGFGWYAETVVNTSELRDALAGGGRMLIDARIDPAGYGDALQRLRG